jgi:peptidoglycan/LPS O-acetylase OafA/YrhL
MQFIWLALIIYCIVAASMRAATGIPFPYAWPWFISLMIGGAILRRRDDARLSDPRLLTFSLLGLLASAFIIAVCIYHDADTYNKSWLRDFIANATAIILFVIGNYAVHLRSKILAYFGKISYSLYLFHPLILVVWSRLLDEKISGQGAMGTIFFTVTILAPIFMISAASYHLIELRGIAIARKIIDSLHKQAPAFSARLP